MVPKIITLSINPNQQIAEVTKYRDHPMFGCPVGLWDSHTPSAWGKGLVLESI